MSIGENVKALRLRAGYTQSELANAAGIQLTQISRIENNDTDPKSSTLKKVMEALGCSANDLFNKPEHEIMSLEDFIASIDYRSGMDMRTAVIVWREVKDHKEFIDKIDAIYKKDPDPRGEVIRKIYEEQGLDPDVEIAKLIEQSKQPES